MPGIRRRSRPRPAQPRTVMGVWLRAMLFDDDDTRRQLAHQLNGGNPGFSHDEAAVVHAACDLAVRRLWGSDYDLRVITAAVSSMRQANLDKGHTPPGSQLEMEAVIRAALGETNVDPSGISPTLAFGIEIPVMGYAVLMLRLTEPEIDLMLLEAERMAVERGWHPPLV